MNYHAELSDYKPAEFYAYLDSTNDRFGFDSITAAVYKCVCEFNRAYGKAFPRVNTIVRKVMRVRRTVQRKLKLLEKLGLIRREPRYDASGRQQSNEFIIILGVSPCHPLQSNNNKTNKLLSIRDLFKNLVKKTPTINAFTERLTKTADEMTKGTKNAQELIIDWAFWWKERHPDKIFTETALEKLFRGWVFNSFNSAVYP